MSIYKRILASALAYPLLTAPVAKASWLDLVPQENAEAAVKGILTSPDTPSDFQKERQQAVVRGPDGSPIGIVQTDRVYRDNKQLCAEYDKYPYDPLASSLSLNPKTMFAFSIRGLKYCMPSGPGH